KKRRGPGRPRRLRRQGKPRRSGRGARGSPRAGASRRPPRAGGRGTGLRRSSRREPRAPRVAVHRLRRADRESIRRRLEGVPANPRRDPRRRRAFLDRGRRPLRGPAAARFPRGPPRRRSSGGPGLRRDADEYRSPRGGHRPKRHRRPGPGGDSLSDGRAGRGGPVADWRRPAAGGRTRRPLSLRPDSLPRPEEPAFGADRLFRVRPAASSFLGRADSRRAGLHPRGPRGRGEGRSRASRGGRGRLSRSRARAAREGRGLSRIEAAAGIGSPSVHVSAGRHGAAFRVGSRSHPVWMLSSIPLVLLVGVVAARDTPTEVSPTSITGHWEGELVRQGARLPVSFDFSTGATGVTGTFTSLTQRAMEFPLDKVTITGRTVHFTLGEGSLVFDGRLEGESLDGTLREEDAPGEFALRRMRPRPQPYKREDVSFRNGDATLS